MRKRHDVTAVFGGIGGFELGLHGAGHRVSLFCERDPDAVSVLKSRFRDVPVCLDVCRTDEVVGAIAGSSDLLTAGFPCTDLSQAGTTLGFAGGRSSLIRETIEILRRRPFPNVLIENVPNWRHLHRGAYLREVLTAFEKLGYKWAYRTLDAQAFGLPQRRLRIFLFACLDGDPRDVLFHGEETPVVVDAPLDREAHGFYWTEGSRGLGWGEDCVPTLKGGSSIGIPAPPAVLMPCQSIVTPSIVDCERLQGFPAGWSSVVERDALVGGGRFQERRRWHLVGNAVCVLASKWIGEQMAACRPFSGADGATMNVDDPLPPAAWFDGFERRRATVGPWPVALQKVRLANFLSEPGSLLSVRATAGFHSRISASRLTFKPGFVTAVERHLRRMERLAEAMPSRPARRVESVAPIMA